MADTWIVKTDVREALDSCRRAGGGTVVVPPGEWRCGALALGSGMRLHLEKGAVLIFSDRPEDYLPPVFTRWEGTECYNYAPLIGAADAEGVSVTGEGTLRGSGRSWWHMKLEQQAAAEELAASQSRGVPVEKRVYGTREAALRPPFLQFLRCRQVLVEGILVEDGPQWCIHPVYCEDVTVRGVTVVTRGPNTDGLNPDSCHRVLIEDCRFDTGDDCIALSSGLNEDGWRVNRPCEDVEIRRCVMTGGHSGIALGSPVSGGIRNVYAHDCDISGTMQGIRLKSMRGRGGYIDGARFARIRIRNVSQKGIQINQFYESSTVQPLSDTPSAFRNLAFEDIDIRGAAVGVRVSGLAELPTENVTLKNITVQAEETLQASHFSNLRVFGLSSTAGGGE